MQASRHAAAQARLRAAWQARGPLALSLRPLSWLYGALAAVDRTLYRRGWRRVERLPVPVVVVGNVVAGGAGKTPATLAVVRHLREAGWCPGVLSRGHGRQERDVRLVDATSDPGEVGDEPLLLHHKSGVPVAVAPRRSEAGRALLATHPEVDILVCDDGLQHRALARDLAICVFDSRGTGNGWLLPAGPLREPWPREVDLVLLTEPLAHPLPGASSMAVHQARRKLAPYALDASGHATELISLAQDAVTAVAAIARPEAFFTMLRAAGLPLALTIALPDHADFAQEQHWMRSAHTVLCTEKDAAKLRRHRPDALAVPLELHIPDAFFADLDRLLAPLREPV